jgi:hypothetical protein
MSSERIVQGFWVYDEIVMTCALVYIPTKASRVYARSTR